MKTKIIEKRKFYNMIVNFESATGETVSYKDTTAIVYDVIHRQSRKSGQWFNTSNVVIGTFDHEPTDTEFKDFVGRLRAVWIEERSVDMIELNEKDYAKIREWDDKRRAEQAREYHQNSRGSRAPRDQYVAIFNNPENLDEKGICVDARFILANEKHPKNISEFDEIFKTNYENQGFEFCFVGKATGAQLVEKIKN